MTLKYAKNLVLVFLFFHPAVGAEQVIMDSFSRDTLSGWGSSDNGHNWDIQGDSSKFIVNSGVGSIIVSAEGFSRRAFINNPSINTEILSSFRWDTAPSIGHVFAGTALRISTDFSNYYFARVRNSNGKPCIGDR